MWGTPVGRTRLAGTPWPGSREEDAETAALRFVASVRGATGRPEADHGRRHEVPDPWRHHRGGPAAPGAGPRGLDGRDRRLV